jgi:hypothetical protein
MTIGNVFPITPSRLPRSPGRAKVAAAVTALQTALNQMYDEENTKEAARERARREGEAKAQRRVHLAQARQATANLRVEVGARWFWDFSGAAIDCMRDLAREARRQGQQGQANALEARIDDACDQLAKIQQKEAAR